MLKKFVSKELLMEFSMLLENCVFVEITRLYINVLFHLLYDGTF